MPTVYRVVMTLASEGYLDHLPNGDYRPGVRTLTLGTAALRSLDLVAIATPKLTELGERTGETVNLAVLSGDRVLYLIRLRNSDLVTANIQVGSTLPAVHTSIGKLLLAQLDEADLQSRITDASFAANSGPNAKVSLAELRDELRTIRDQGWAMQDEELAYGLRSVAGPITAPTAAWSAGVNLRRPGARLVHRSGSSAKLRPVVLATCAEISALLSDTTAGCLTSGARIGKLEPAALDAEQRSLYDAIAGGRRAQGPQLFRLVDAERAAGGPVQRLPAAARGSGRPCRRSAPRCATRPRLDDRSREIAILVVAAHWRSDFEWYAHEAVGRAAGLGDAELGRPARGPARRAGRAPSRGRAHGRGAGRAAATSTTPTYAEAVGQLGPAGLFELLTLVGYYAHARAAAARLPRRRPDADPARLDTRRRPHCRSIVKSTFVE